jgi:hypothetical protein
MSCITKLVSAAGAHVPTEAAALARAYGGTLAGVMDQLGMFVIEIDDARASALAGDARVMNVSQDRTLARLTQRGSQGCRCRRPALR